MSSEQIKVLVQSSNPMNGSRLWYHLMYGEEFGGKVTPDVKIQGDVYIPMTSWVTGRCHIRDVKIPHNTNIIALSVHDKHQRIDKIGDFQLVENYRVLRGVYVSGLIRIEDHQELKARIIIGYELKIYGRQHLTLHNYKKTQKQKNRDK